MTGAPEPAPHKPRLPSGMRGTQPGWNDDDTETPPPAPPPPQQPPPIIDKAAIAKITKSGKTALWLGAAALILSLLVVYLGIIAGIAAIVVGFRAQAAGRRVPMRVPGAMAGIVMGIAGSVLSLLMISLLLYVWSDWQAYTKCRDRANTIADETVCKDTLSRAIEHKFGFPKGSFHVPF